MPRTLKLAFASLTFAVLTFITAQPAFADPFGVNLIVNGNAEAGTTGFTTTGAFTTVAYGTGNFPDVNDPGPPNRGTSFFAGGNAALSTGSQFIDVSSGASGIDAGTSTFNLEAYLGGFSSQNDNAVLSVSFLSATSSVLGTATLGPVTAADRNNQTGLLLRTASGGVPVGTRGINVTLTMTRASGTSNDGYADNLSLVLNASGSPTPPPPSAVPEPTTLLLLGTGLAGIVAKVRRRRA